MHDTEQETLRYLVAAASRSGSMFLLHLMQAFLGSEIAPLAKVHSARNSVDDFTPDYRTFRNQNRVCDFVTEHNIKTLKLEDPGLDQDSFKIAKAFPKSKVVGVFRPVLKIVFSHANIKPWGMPATRVVNQWITALDFYESMQAQGRLFMIDLEQPAHFDTDAFAGFLGCDSHETAKQFVAKWPRINDLQTLKAESGDASPVSPDPKASVLTDAFPEIISAEIRYRALI